MIEASSQVRVGSVIFFAAHGMLVSIDATAKALTGSAEYFLPKATARAHAEKWKRIEAGEEPWPK
jgi:hypothetical protein